MNDPLASATTESTTTAAKPAAAGRCGNCGTALLGPYCYVCGQPKKGWIRKISGIAADFLDTVFDLDSRIPRTLGPLYFKPGFLTCEYFEGRRVRYVTPLRLYFFLSVIAFFALGVLTPIASDAGGNAFQIELGEDPARPSERADELRAALAALEKQRTNMPVAAFAAAEQAIKGQLADLEQADQDAGPASPPTPSGAPNPRLAGASRADDPDDPNPHRLTFFGSKPWHPETNPLRVDWLGVDGNRWLNAQVGVIATNLQTARKHPDRLVNQMLAKAPQVLFVLLPVFALLLKLMFLFKRRLYMEHLIVALHSHSFLSLSILLIAALSALAALLPEGSAGLRLVGLVEGLAWAWIPLNLLIAHKRIYRQGWFFTLLKFSMIGLCYTVLISLGMVLNVVLSLATL